MAKFITWAAVEGESLDPFEVGDSLSSIGVNTTDVKSLKGGKYLISVEKEEDVDKLLLVETLAAGTKIVAKMHGTLNGCKCVITCPEVKNKPIKELKALLKDAGVTDVERKGDVLFLTLASKERPKVIKIGALKVRTVPFYPTAMLCYRCFVYGHKAKLCRNKKACQRCGGYHGDKCPGKPTCRNCGGPHLPTHRKCPVWRQETAIQKLIVDKELSGPKARELYKRTHKKDYIVPPRVCAEARADPIEPKAEPESKTTDKTAKTKAKKRSLKPEASDTEEQSVPPRKTTKKDEVDSISSNISISDLEGTRPRPEKTVQELIDEEMAMMKVIYDSAEEPEPDEKLKDEEAPTPAKNRSRSKGRSSRKSK